MGGKSGQTIGYHYIMTLLLGDCRGPVNEYLAIEGDDKLAWQGNASNAVPQKINSPDLFGGEKGEGGIQGAFTVLQGAHDQVLPGATSVDGIGATGPCQSITIPNIKTSIGGRVSELRGFVSLLYHGLVSSMNPYPKEWHLLRWRTTAGWHNDTCWYPAKATISAGSVTLTAGTTVSLTWRQNTYQQGTNDEARMGLAFVDSGGALIGSITWATMMAPTLSDGWLLRSLSSTVPTGAARVRLYMEMQRHTGDDNDGYIDAINLIADGIGVSVINPSGEDGTAGWVAEVGSIGNGPKAGSDQPAPYEGSAYFNGGKNDLTRVYQDTGIGNIRAMNAAHIIYQSLTDPEWGASRSPSDLDENSFILAANTLCNERFGLCINWTRQEDVDTFLQHVLDHVMGALYTDRTTGKIVFKLIRNDYVAADLPLYDFSSGLLEVTEDDSGSSDEIINEIIVQGKDQSLDGRGNDFEVRVHNNSARQSQGAISDTLALPGLPTRELGTRRGQMELAVHAPGLKRFKLKFDRRAWQLTPAAVIRISSPLNNISNMVVRLGDDIDYGNSTDGTISVSAIEDVFGMPTVSFQSAGSSTWTAPDTTPAPAAATKLIEAGYRDLVRRVGTSTTDAVAPTSSYIGQLAKSAGYAYRYELLSRVSGEADFVDRATGSFTDRAVLSTNVTALATTIVVSDLGGLTAANVGEAVLCEDEVMRLDGVDEGTLTLTVARGCADSIPTTHTSGSSLWLLDDDLISDGREYASTEVVETKVLTRTTSAVLAEADAATNTVTIAARHYKPYPPGNVQVDGTSCFSLVGGHPAPVITWTHRDRLSENDQLIEHTASSVGPEAGTTYTIRVKSADGATTLRTVTGITTTTWTYDSTMQTADGSPDTVTIELESVRDAAASWQMYSFQLPIIVAAPPTDALVYADFKNNIYSISGVTKALSEVVEQNTAWGTYTDSDVVPGSGLNGLTAQQTSFGSKDSSPVLTAAAFAAVGSTGFTAVMTFSVAVTGSGRAIVGVETDANDFSSGWGVEMTRILTGDGGSHLYDLGSLNVASPPVSAGVHKAAFTLSGSGLAISIDGGAVTTTAAPEANTPEFIGLWVNAAVDSGSTGPVTAVLEKIEFFSVVTSGTLPTLSTP